MCAQECMTPHPADQHTQKNQTNKIISLVSFLDFKCETHDTGHMALLEMIKVEQHYNSHLLKHQ